MAYQSTLISPVLVSGGARSLSDLESTIEAAPTITDVERIPGDTVSPCLGLAMLRVTHVGTSEVSAELADFASLTDYLPLLASLIVRDFASYEHVVERIET